MSATAVFPPVERDRHPLALPVGLALSLLLHLTGYILLKYPLTWPEPQPKAEFVVEVVRLPAPMPKVAPTPALPPPPVPRFEDAPTIGEESTPVTKPAPQPAPPAPQRARPPIIIGGGLAPPAPPKPSEPFRPNTTAPAAEPLASERLSATRHGGSELQQPAVASQSVQDFILKQIAHRWLIDVHSPRYRNLRLSLGFVLLPDGTLGPPFGKNDPWDLTRMLAPEAYQAIQQPGQEAVRSALITFLQAMRQAQPFRLPPDETSYKSRVLPLSFRMDDLPQ